MVNTQLINFIPNTFIDDFFTFGFLGGFVSYAWYLFSNRKAKKEKVGFISGFYGVILSGCLGGLLAIAVDRSIELSIVVGLVNQVLYLAIMKSVKDDGFVSALKEIIISLLTAGAKGVKK